MWTRTARGPRRSAGSAALPLAIIALIAFAAPAYASPEVEPRGRMHLDAAAHFGEEDAEFADGLHTRRIRMGLGGTLTESWDYRIEFDFAEEGVGARDVRLRRDLGPGRLWIGQYKVPMGLNELTSSNNITFVERSTPTAIVTDAFQLGLAYDYFADEGGFMAMAFGRSIGDATEGDMRMGLAGRGVYAPYLGQARLHLGLSGAFEHRRDETGIGFSDRPEVRGADGGTHLIDTGDFDAEMVAKAGAELAFISGPFSAEAEYLAVLANRDVADDVFFGGFHAQASYVLTGESRGYSDGIFGSPSPDRDYGAWEAAVRVSYMDLDDADLLGGTQTNLTAGLNWYATDRVRFLLNNVVSFVEDGAFGDETVNLIVGRAQYSF